jgi:hypothetical protein
MAAYPSPKADFFILFAVDRNSHAREEESELLAFLDAVVHLG